MPSGYRNTKRIIGAIHNIAHTYSISITNMCCIKLSVQPSWLYLKNVVILKMISDDDYDGCGTFEREEFMNFRARVVPRRSEAQPAPLQPWAHAGPLKRRTSTGTSRIPMAFGRRRPFIAWAG